MKKSGFLKLNSRDFWRGLIVSGITAGLTALSSALSSASDFANFNWQGVLLAAAGGFVSYITLNLFTNSSGEAKQDDNK